MLGEGKKVRACMSLFSGLTHTHTHKLNQLVRMHSWSAKALAYLLCGVAKIFDPDEK